MADLAQMIVPPPVAPEDPRYVSPELYRLLADIVIGRRPSLPVGDPALRPTAESFLFWEARLLDERRLEEWLDLFTVDCIYWVMINGEGSDPENQLSLMLDDRRRLVDRVALLETGLVYPESPPSRTSRQITNVEAWSEVDGMLRVRSNLTLTQFRLGNPRVFVGSQEHFLVKRDTGLQIRWKVVNFLAGDQPLKFTSILL